MIVITGPTAEIEFLVTSRRKKNLSAPVGIYFDYLKGNRGNHGKRLSIACPGCAITKSLPGRGSIRVKLTNPPFCSSTATAGYRRKAGIDIATTRINGVTAAGARAFLIVFLFHGALVPFLFFDYFIFVFHGSVPPHTCAPAGETGF
jgi:hypothetical protein